LYRGSSYNLETMKRDILTKLGRTEEALEDAWQNFLKHPDEFSHKELIRHIPKQQRIEWHPRILEVINTAPLSSATITLLLQLQEMERLAQRLRKTIFSGVIICHFFNCFHPDWFKICFFIALFCLFKIG